MAAPDSPALEGPADPAVDPVTPARIGRVVVGMLTSSIGALIALITPIQLLLTLHLVDIAGQGAAAAFGVVTGLGALVALFANPIGGRLSDRTAARFGRRRTWILTGGLIGSAILFVLPITSEVWQVALLWCFVQGAFNFQQAATNALLADQVPERRRGTASGIGALGGTLGPLVGLTAVSLVQDPTWQWYIAGIAGVVGCVVAVLILRDPAKARAPRTERMSLLELSKTFWFNPAQFPALGFAWLIRFLLTTAYVSSTYNALLLIDHFGVAPAEVAGIVLTISVVGTLITAVVAVVGGPISDRVGRQKPFVIASGVLLAVALIMMAFAPSVGFVIAAAVPLGIGGGLFFAIDLAMCVRMLPNMDDAGKDFAILNIANTLPQSIVPFIAPGLIALGGYPALYLTLAVAGLVGAGLVLRLPEIGKEGDPRWAQIRRSDLVAATPAES